MMYDNLLEIVPSLHTALRRSFLQNRTRRKSGRIRQLTGISLGVSCFASTAAWAQEPAQDQIHENCFPPGVSVDHAPDPDCDPVTGEQKPQAPAPAIAPLRSFRDSLWSYVYPGQTLWSYQAFELLEDEPAPQEIYSKLSCSVEGPETFLTVYFAPLTKTPADPSLLEPDQFPLEHGQLVKIPENCKVGGLVVLETFYRNAGFSSDVTVQQMLGMLVDVPEALENTSGTRFYTHIAGQGSYKIVDTAAPSQASELMMLGLTPDDLKFSAQENDLILTVRGNESIRLVDQYATNDYYGVDTLVFVKDSNAIRWSRKDIRNRAVADAKPFGQVQGSYLDEAYTHRYGDGSYSIEDNGPVNRPDTLTLKNLQPQEITFSADGDDISIHLPGQESIHILKQRYQNQWHGVETLEFPDATPPVSWTRQDILNRVVADAKSTGTVVGSWFSETYVHQAGDGSYSIEDVAPSNRPDTLVLNNQDPENMTLATDGDDIILNLPGQESIRIIKQRYQNQWNGIETLEFPDAEPPVSWTREDLLNRAVADAKATGNVVGSWFSEVYTHELGDGSYSIDDTGPNNRPDTLILKNRQPQDITFGTEGDDIIIKLPGQESIRIIKQRYQNQWHGIEALEFPDAVPAVSWTRQDILNRVVADAKSTGSVVGSWFSETYVHQAGDGSYSIDDVAPNNRPDTLILKDQDPENMTFAADGDDIILNLPGQESIRIIKQRYQNQWHGIEALEFPDAEPAVSWTREDLLNRVVADAKATGTVVGSWFSEVYTHELEDGSYTIDDTGPNNRPDTLILKNRQPQELSFSADGDDIIILLPGQESIRILKQRYQNQWHGIEALEFPDAVPPISWTRQDILNRVVADAKSTGTVVGSWFSETYVHQAGDGSYSIDDAAPSNRTDTLILEDHRPEDLTLNADGDDLVLQLPGQVSIRIIRQLYQNRWHGIEILRFEGGGNLVEWDREQIAQRAQGQ